ncbi:hypothetical protein B0A50_07965 [Salinomyces thailandicus]|uniref:Synaptobrevin n=1 Tax=Salinomyces thailandicus TaxID=706561 RepID=A0A4U0TKT0_9PEZI|nr:hypothetical protein B0A50_07965 [Salinomyces thailandica]
MDTTSTTTLNRLLAKLDSTLLSSTSTSTKDPLRTSQYERNRVGANIEHARTLLLTLEKQSSTVRIQSQRQEAQADLQSKRDLIKRLNARLQELDQQDNDEDDEEDSDDDEDTTDLLKQYAPARQDVTAGIDTGEPPSPPPTTKTTAPQPTTANNESRSRRPPQASDNHSAASTTAREALFADRTKPTHTNPSDLSAHELEMSHNRNEQEALSNGLLGLARALKGSAQQMGVSIESEKDVMKRAEGGLDKSAQGMEAAERKMGMLRRMSEGQGWYGRIKLYGFIFALWIGCFVLVFIGPKLRL